MKSQRQRYQFKGRNVKGRNVKGRSLRFIVVSSLCLSGIALTAVLGWKYRADSSQHFNYPFMTFSTHDALQQAQAELTFLQKRAQIQPNDGLVRAELAQTYFNLGRTTGETQWYLQAEQAATRSRALLPFDNKGATLVLARVAEAKHDFNTSIQLAQQVLAKQPDHEGALSLLVTSYLAQGKVEKAAPLATQLASQVPTLPSLMLQALVKVAQGKDTVAQQLFEDAIAAEDLGESSSSARVRVLYGRYLLERGQVQRAKSLFQSALEILPQYPLALVSLAQLEAQVGHYQRAESLYEQVFASVSTANVLDHQAYAGRAELYALQGDQKKAQEWWNRAEKFLREHTDLSTFGHERELAKVLLVRGNTQDQAEALWLMRSEVQRRGDANTLETLAWALSRSGRWQEALNVIQRALATKVQDAQLYLRGAAIARHLNQADLAQRYETQAKVINPQFSENRKALLGLI